MGVTAIIKSFLMKYAIKVVENESSDYIELMMGNHKCIKYQGKYYYILENNSFYTEDDEILKDMLFSTFGL